MNKTREFFKVGKTITGTNFLQETIRNKKIFLDWSNVSTLSIYLHYNYIKQSFYSLDVCKRIERPEEIDRFINKVLLPFYITRLVNIKKINLNEVELLIITVVLW